MRDELLQRAQDAVAMGLAAGADDVVASAGWGRSLEFQWRDDKVEKVQENTSKALRVALYVDGRFSSHGTNDLDPERLKHFVGEAVALTRAIEPDPFRKITPAELYANRPETELDLVDPNLTVDATDAMTREQRLDWIQRLHDAAHADESVISATSGMMDSHSLSARVTSNGFEGTMERTSLWFGAECTIQDGEKRPEAWRWIGGLHRDGLQGPEEVGAECLRRALSRRGQRKAESRKATMIVDPESGAGLIGRIFGALSAGAIQQKRSFLADKKGQQIASKVLTLTDDPLIPRGMGSRLYDGEGISSKRRTILNEGVLESFFVDTYYGRKLGWEPTSGSASNILFEHGDKDRDGLIADVGEGILVTNWLGGNANSTTGDFSFGMRGHLIENGQIGDPVSEMNVTGNYLDLLQRLVTVGNDPVPWSAFRCPTLVFDGIEFSGL
ncbi:MAG: TldD/PmbA family protein [Deltaproteobacteria bacterium]|nr:TldD/PmbA family protein [Deltaproteobacteria bacterium]